MNSPSRVSELQELIDSSTEKVVSLNLTQAPFK